MSIAISRRPQPIVVLQRRFGHFPKSFVWNGETIHVEHIVRCWTQTGRLIFRVECALGVFDLTQNVHTNTWTLQPITERS